LQPEAALGPASVRHARGCAHSGKNHRAEKGEKDRT
jgi:hypothetical protein